jgi:hypothetical protein
MTKVTVLPDDYLVRYWQWYENNRDPSTGQVTLHDFGRDLAADWNWTRRDHFSSLWVIIKDGSTYTAWPEGLPEPEDVRKLRGHTLSELWAYVRAFDLNARKWIKDTDQATEQGN